MMGTCFPTFRIASIYAGLSGPVSRVVTDQSPGAGSSTCSRGAARGEARRFNNEFSDNCGNSTRSEIVFNFHRNKDCLSTILFGGNILDIVTIMQALLSSVFPKLRLSLEVASHIVEMCNLGT